MTVIQAVDFAEIYHDISTRITGRIAIYEDEAVLLAETVAGSQLHVEVGTMWGGTAIMAALAGAELTYTIDSLGANFWRTYDPPVGKKPTTDIVIKNFKQFGVSERVKWIIAPSHPWPIAGLKPDTFFIDGDHSHQGCLFDWQTACEITRRAILVHDYDAKHPGVRQAVDTVAFKNPRWKMTKKARSMLLFERVA